ECAVSCDFFFQAEDGIRDRNVTGVQTCALPISPPIVLPEPIYTRSLARVVRAQRQPSCSRPTRQSSGTNTSSKKTSLNIAWPVRSEERRVGKECRCGWWRDH